MTVANVLNFAKDAQGTPTYSPATSNTKWKVGYTTNTESNITLPTDFANYNVLFSYSSGANVWVDVTGATSTVPASAALTPCTNELNPGQRTVPGGTKISIISSDTAGGQMGIAAYGIP